MNFGKLIVRAATLVSSIIAPLYADNQLPLADLLDSIRIKHHLPALGAAIFTTDGIKEIAAVGVRKAGTTIRVTDDDLWHLGSDTKAMTATLVGTFVAEKKLRWNDKILSYFPEIAGSVPPFEKEITIAQVLSHQAGLSENLSPGRRSFLSGSSVEQRKLAVPFILQSPAYPVGAFHYSNNGYILIGALLEKISGESWETLMRERLFKPLRMDSAGFGGTGTVGQIDQPWPHTEGGSPARSNGPNIDNPPYTGPAGNVHCSMADWAKFLIDQLRGGAGKPALLPTDIYAAIQTAAPNSNYGFGWIIVQRKWANGPMLSHAGSNTMNYAACWLGPIRGLGVLVCSNQGGASLNEACNEVAEVMLARYAKTSPR